jgi:hypothetical protein
MNRTPKEGMLAVLYPIPDPLSSEEDCQRFQHYDLAEMTRAELTREYARLTWRLLFDDTPHNWLVEREDRLKRLLHTRKSYE